MKTVHQITTTQFVCFHLPAPHEDGVGCVLNIVVLIPQFGHLAQTADKAIFLHFAAYQREIYHFICMGRSCNNKKPNVFIVMFDASVVSIISQIQFYYLI